jgi:hypothetical protein
MYSLSGIVFYHAVFLGKGCTTSFLRTGYASRVLPDTFRPILWSYDFDRIDPLTHKKTIIVQAINYGTLAHWRWLREQYGREGVRKVLSTRPGNGDPAARSAARLARIRYRPVQSCTARYSLRSPALSGAGSGRFN